MEKTASMADLLSDPLTVHLLYLTMHEARKKEYPDMITPEVEAQKERLEQAFREKGYSSPIEGGNIKKWVSILPVSEHLFVGILGSSISFDMFYLDDEMIVSVSPIAFRHNDLVNALGCMVGRDPDISYISDSSREGTKITYEWTNNPQRRLSELEEEALKSETMPLIAQNPLPKISKIKLSYN